MSRRFFVRFAVSVGRADGSLVQTLNIMSEFDVCAHVIAIVAASDSQDAAKIVQSIFMDGTFRVYTNHDIIGTELGGSLKNVIAIAAGIIDGIGYGDNSKAALITRGITEITRLGMAAGAKE